MENYVKHQIEKLLSPLCKITEYTIRGKSVDVNQTSLNR